MTRLITDTGSTESESDAAPGSAETNTGQGHRSRLWSWVELTGATAIGFAWPLFQGAGSGADGFTNMRADWLDLIIFGLLAVFLLPTVLFVIETLIGLRSRRWSLIFHAAALGGLFGLIFALAPNQFGLPAVAGIFAWVCASVAIAYLWLRTRFIQSVVRFFAVAIPVTLIAFWFTGPGASVMAGGPELPEGVPPSSGPPVVVIMLDEFPLAGLLSSPGEIDSARFPGFASLARQSTWYSHAHTNADQSVDAIPALLGGDIPDKDQTPPNVYNHPDNLFTALNAAGYEVEADEQFTDLCPHSVCPNRDSRPSRVRQIALNGLDASGFLPQSVRNRLNFELPLPDEQQKSVQIERMNDFLENLSPQPGSISYIHFTLPHKPWTVLPDGRVYSSEPRQGMYGGDAWPDKPNLIKFPFQRFMLQVGYIDRQISKLIDLLKEQGVWKETALVVVSDHGVSAKAGLTRRWLNHDNAGWILPVPLFVKFPGQTEGRVVKRNFPTIGLSSALLKSLGVEPPPGISVSPDEGPDGKVLASSKIEGMVELTEAEIRRKLAAAVAYRNATFAGDSVFATGGHPGLLGKSAAGKDLPPVSASFEAPWPDARVDLSKKHLPAWVSGTVDGESCPAALALSLNGKIVGTTGTWEDDGECIFASVLDPAGFRDGENHLDLYGLD